MSASATAQITERKIETGNLNRSTVQPTRSPESEASTHEEIAKLAYALWEQRGRPNGSAEVDWLQAERELRQSSQAYSR
jgi:DUF2934 family protein